MSSSLDAARQTLRRSRELRAIAAGRPARPDRSAALIRAITKCYGPRLKSPDQVAIWQDDDGALRAQVFGCAGHRQTVTTGVRA